MSKVYEEEEKRMYLDAFNVSGKTKTAFARENNIPEATFRAWIKENEYLTFGAIQLNNHEIAQPMRNKRQSTIFSCENIRIELKEGFDKNFLRRIVEVLINDK